MMQTSKARRESDKEQADTQQLTEAAAHVSTWRDNQPAAARRPPGMPTAVPLSVVSTTVTGTPSNLHNRCQNSRLEVAEDDGPQVRVRQAAEGLRVEAGAGRRGSAGGVPQRSGSGLRMTIEDAIRHRDA